MKEFFVPRQQIAAHVRLADGTELDGDLFYDASGPGGVPGRLIDRLNDDGERFVPFKSENRGLLLHKAGIRYVRLDGEGARSQVHEPPADHHVRVTIRMDDGRALTGLLDYAMPADRERLFDFLNVAPQFLTIRGGDETLTFVHRESVCSIEGSEERG